MAWIPLQDGQQLHVREIGRGPLVVLLHGFGMNSLQWLPVVAPLAHRFRFILPDLRGFGPSHNLHCRQRCVLASHAADINDLLQHYGSPEIRLGGISLGAFVALQYMKLHGTDNIQTYVNIDQGPRIHNTADWHWGIFGKEGAARMQRLRGIMDSFNLYSPDMPYAQLPLDIRRQLYVELGDFVASAMSKSWLKKTSRFLLQQPMSAHTLFPVDNWHTYVQHMDAYLNLDYDLREVLPRLDMPVTLIVGKHSEMYPWQGQAAMRRYLPDPTLVMLEKSGHLPMLDEPVRFIRELARALRAE